MWPAIETIVPHSGDMVLLDRVLAIGEETIQTEVIITAQSLFCQQGRVGAWVGIEYMAQTIAAYAGHQATLQGQPVKVGFLLGSRRYECLRPFFAVGDVLTISATVMMQVENGLGSFDCVIECGGEKIVTATLSVFQPNDLENMAMGAV